MSFIILVTSSLLFICLLIFFIVNFLIKNDGSIGQEHISIDTGINPGMTLYSTSLNLLGRPDYLIKEKDIVVPVEVKTGSTPKYPYQNHVAQLMAYCLLVEENFGVKPTHGYLRYPGQEYKVPYTIAAEKMIKNLVKEIEEAKEKNQEYHCTHPYHQVN